ncbi:MAG: prolipoprotein diacylglyceryl transferase [Betaproteobacteria bacterium]|nr:prolipoprotein diacylglyceryl transferase [Betaproteobacteria bacterium]
MILMLGPYVHNIDPIIGSVFGIYLWWYGLSYTLGFLNAHRFVRGRRGELGLDMKSIYDLSLLLAGGVLLGGRFVEVVFYEWPFYREHFYLVPAFWLGGMATHGLLFGGLTGTWLFCRLNRKSFLSITDALAIPAAFILGAGRIGNFIDGQIVGSVTTVWWAVKFPDAEGFRHPVVLYDGMKNLLIIPILWYAARRKPPTGVLTGIFLFLYAFLRIFVDVFREYPTSLLGLATGQVLNILMSILGLVLIVFPFWSRRSHTGNRVALAAEGEQNQESAGVAWRRMLFALLLLFSLVMPSDWTQDVPARYGKRHADISYSAIYPRIDTSPKNPQPKIQSLDAPIQPTLMFPTSR